MHKEAEARAKRILAAKQILAASETSDLMVTAAATIAGPLFNESIKFMFLEERTEGLGQEQIDQLVDRVSDLSMMLATAILTKSAVGAARALDNIDAECDRAERESRER